MLHYFITFEVSLLHGRSSLKHWRRNGTPIWASLTPRPVVLKNGGMVQKFISNTNSYKSHIKLLQKWYKTHNSYNSTTKIKNQKMQHSKVIEKSFCISFVWLLYYFNFWSSISSLIFIWSFYEVFIIFVGVLYEFSSMNIDSCRLHMTFLLISYPLFMRFVWVFCDLFLMCHFNSHTEFKSHRKVMKISGKTNL